MLSSASIQSIRDEATEAAKLAGKEPVRVADLNPDDLYSNSIPFLGDYIPDGWRIAPDTDGDQTWWLVDSTGLDNSGRALSHEDFADLIRRLQRTDDGWALAVIEAGEFQVVVGGYLPDFGDFTGSGLLTKQERRDVLA